MEIVVYVVLGVIVGVFIAWVITRMLATSKGEEKREQQGMILLQNQIENLTKTIDSKLGESNKEMQTAVRAQFGESQKLIKDITEQITHVKETNKQVVNVADQLKSLQNTLQNPKQRGVLGEYYLDTVLKNIFPPGQYQLQYKFDDGDIVDAVIFLKDKILPIDSKFSLENYNRIVAESDGNERVRLEKLFVQDIKNRIDETAKYIRPKENTMDFAFMFIPSEAIYYDLLVNKMGADARDLIEYAFRDKHVIIVSPTSFMAYLQTVLQGLRALQIEESAKEIQKRVGELGRHIGTYDQYMAKLGNALGTTVNHFNTAHKELKKIDKDVLKISGVSHEVEALVLSRPESDE
ncbi:MAG: DNA recombination protein RmuC [Candidatus Yonathbacteria bacterium]|nr:DNA recombination protein RmuC [Candidatus Yonathbacteria bacterium]